MRLPRLVIFKESGEFQAGMLYAEKARRASLAMTYITRMSHNIIEVIGKLPLAGRESHLGGNFLESTEGNR
jgi:hypothetical protein